MKTIKKEELKNMGVTAINCCYDSLFGISDRKYQKELFIIEKEGKQGLLKLINKDTYKEILPCEFDDIYVGSSNEIRVENDGKTGIYNYDGTVVLPCEFSGISYPSKKGIRIISRGKNDHALINAKGDFIISFGIYDNIFIFGCDNEHVYTLHKGNKVKVYDPESNMILDGEYDNVRYFDNLLIGRENKMDKILNKSIDNRFNKFIRINNIDDNNEYVIENNFKYYYLNLNNNFVAELKYFATRIDDKLCIVYYGIDNRYMVEFETGCIINIEGLGDNTKDNLMENLINKLEDMEVITL